MPTIKEVAAELELRLEFRIQQLEGRIHERWANPEELHGRMPKWAISNRVAELENEPDAWEKIVNSELIPIGKSILLGYYTALGELQNGTDEAAVEVVESLEVAAVLTLDDPLPLLLWCSSRCRSDPV